MICFSAISIIITLCLGSIRCFQGVKSEKLPEDENSQSLLLPEIGENDCKGDENEWIKPTVTGYLVGQLIGVIFGIALCIAFIYHCILKNLKFLS
ncbi:unnamed protein product [Cercopithifilaria johnstoni]|uniref:Uncharacterized protein n=1 Tax=Cercopithifilaria johnstoni TaxID=2874296 RepID=A0A8J2MS90_9BILA|nr:unnamed protein product [Cercopithifilaria johnstoni]